MQRRLPARSTAVLGAAVLTALLVGCAPQTPAAPTPSPSPTIAPTTAVPTPTPTPTPTPSAATPIGFGCDRLLDLQAVYDLNPNLSVVPAAAPPAGSLAATLVAELGVACDLVHNSNGAVLHVAAATPGASAIAALRAGGGNAVDLGIPGVEAVEAGSAVIAFRDGLVLTAEADEYFALDEFIASLRAAIESLG